jgi:hypothetical protein
MLVSSIVLAQEPDPPAPATVAAPSSSDLEPRVNTSAPPAAEAAATAPPAAPAAAPAPASRTAASGPRDGRTMDRLELEASQITGNRELPKVLYIVPWKRSDLGDLIGRPANSLLDEVLEPVDRDVFRRQNRYYEALKPDEVRTASPPGAAAAPAPGPEK